MYRYVWIIGTYIKIKLRNVCFSQVFQDIAEVSANILKKKSHKIKSAQPLFWRIYADLVPRTMRRSTALKIPRSNQISVKFFQVASTSGASPIQSCNLKGFKGSSDILVEKSGWTSPSSIFLSVTSCGGCLKGKQVHSNLCSFVKDQHYQTRIVLIRDIIAYPQYMPTTDIKSDRERGRKKRKKQDISCTQDPSRWLAIVHHLVFPF